MNIFDFRDRLVADYADYVTSFIAIRDERIQERVNNDLSQGLLWPDPSIGLNPAFAKGAVRSVATADEGKDGITYLADAIACGIETPLTSAYRAEILRRTGTATLEQALIKAREAGGRTREAGAHE